MWMCVSLSFTAKRFGVTEVPMEAVTFISHAAQSRLRTVIEKVSTVAQHRMDSCKVTRMAVHWYMTQSAGYIWSCCWSDHHKTNSKAPTIKLKDFSYYAVRVGALKPVTKRRHNYIWIIFRKLKKGCIWFSVFWLTLTSWHFIFFWLH